MGDEATIKALYQQLVSAPQYKFPKTRERWTAIPTTEGVYVIRDSEEGVLYVGRTLGGAKPGPGLRRRIANHTGVRADWPGHGVADLRGTCTYQFVEVDNPRQRALLEALATGLLCPRRLGVGSRDID